MEDELDTSWCMCVVSHGYVRLGGDSDGGAGWHACETNSAVGRMSGDGGALPECKVIN